MVVWVAEMVCRTLTTATDVTSNVWEASAFTDPTDGTDDAVGATTMSCAASSSMRGRVTTGWVMVMSCVAVRV